MLAKRSRVPAEAMKDPRGFAKRSSPFFLLRFRQNALPHSRFAVVVGVKVDRRAAARHKLKRRVAGYLTRQGSRGKDVVVTVLPPAAPLPRKVFFAELGNILNDSQ